MLTILVLCALLSLVAAVLGYLLIFSDAATMSDGSQPTKTRNIKPTPGNPNLGVFFSLCLLVVIRAVFRWWAKHPWMVFWGTILLFYFISEPFVRVISPLFGLLVPTVFLSLLRAIILILCFSRGVFLIWQRSGIRAVLMNVAVPLILVSILAAIAIPQFAVYARSEYYHDVKSNLKNVAKAEEAYFRDNGSYTANIGNLKGFKQSAHVAIVVEVTATTYVITGTVTKRCEPYTGRWAIDSTTGAITGTPCRVTMHGLATMTLP